MADDSFGFYNKAEIMRNALNIFTREVPSRRELDIQIDKLQRMASEFSSKFSARNVRSTPPKKLRKEKGPHLHRLTQQSRRVDALFSQMIAEHLRVLHPERRRADNAAHGRRFTHKLNQKIHEGTQRLLRETNARSEAFRHVLRD